MFRILYRFLASMTRLAVRTGRSKDLEIIGTVALADRVLRGEGVEMLRSHRVVSLPSERSALSDYRFPPEIILLAVRWYLRYGLSYRDVEELLAERGIEVDHVTIYRWVQRFTPMLIDAAQPCRHAVGGRWFVDETYVKVAGVWRYVYRAGASGFLVKRTATDELLHAVRSVAEGDALLSPSVTRMILQQFTAPSPQTSSPDLERLTPRELDVLVEVGHGYSNTEIAERMFVAESTIKTHLKRLLRKLGIRDRVQAVIFAYDNGLVSPGDTNVSHPE